MAIPSYLYAADDHDVMNASEETWSDALLNAPKTLALGLAAGVTEVLNIPPTLGNMLGGDYDKIDFHAELKSLDDDLANYYKQHQLGIDTIGFIAGQFVPGMTGVKVLRGGQAMLNTAVKEGSFGNGIGRSFGLLAPQRDTHLANAIKQIEATGNPFKLMESNVSKAIRAGYGQNVLESAAWETMVMATMQDSPVLTNMDASDLAYNAAFGIAIGGGIGGTLSAVGTIWKTRQAGTAASAALKEFGITTEPGLGTITTDRIIYRQEMLRTIQSKDLTGVPEHMRERASRTQKTAIDSILTDIRKDFGDYAGGDQELAEAAFGSFKLQSPEKNISDLLDGRSISRIGKRSQFESEYKAALEKANKKGIDSLTDEERNIIVGNNVTYVRNHGEGMGDVRKDHPPVTSVTDDLLPGETIELTKRGIKIGKTEYQMDNNPMRAFNIFGASTKQIERRRLWAEKLLKWSDEGPEGRVEPHQVHAIDLPLLEKAYRDGLERLKVIPESGDLSLAKTLNSRDEIKDFMIQQKREIANRLMNRVEAPINREDFVDKLKHYFGINFNVVDEPGVYGFFTKINERGEQSWKLPFTKGKLTGEVIAIDEASALANGMARVARTLKHEEGHRFFQAMKESQGLTAANIEQRMPILLTELRKIGNLVRPAYYKNAAKQINNEVLTHEYFADAFWYLSRHPETLSKYTELNRTIGHLVKPIPQEIVDSISKRASKVSLEEVSDIVNVERGWFDGSSVRKGGYLARDLHRMDYKERLLAAGVRETEIPADPLMLPRWTKMIHKEQKLEGMNGNLMDGLAKVKARTALYDEGAKRIATQILGEELPDLPDSDFLVASSAGAGILSGANANYGTWESILQYVGQRINALIKNAKATTSEVFAPSLSKLSNDLEAAIEWSTLNETLRGLPNKYGLADDGISLTLRGSPDSIAELVAKGIPERIEIKSPVIQNLAREHIDKVSTHTKNKKLIRANEGLVDSREEGIFYPIPRSPRDTPHFAFVVDDTITGTGHSQMIYAASAEALETMKNQIIGGGDGLKVFTKKEAEEYFKAHGQFEFERTINENWINTELKRRGVSQSFLPMTDQKRIIESFLDWHYARDANMVREAVSHRYGRQFEALRKQSADITAAATSKFGYGGKYVEGEADNPANALIKMALDISRKSEYPWWNTLQDILDTGYSKLVTDFGKMFSDAKNPEHLDAVNAALNKAGWNGVSKVDEALYNAMNGTVPRGVLVTHVNRANAVLASFALRFDPMNAFNNIIGSNVLFGTELRSVLKLIEQNDPAAGALAKIKIPDTDQTILAPSKLIANAYHRYFNDKTARAFYKQHGFTTTISEQFDQVMDLLAIRSGDTAITSAERIQKAMVKAKELGNIGEKWTGNTLAEEMNRFVAADVMKQVTDVAIAQGAMDSKTALTYINTFVNRTQGNYLASQRPLIFQGPIGQAMGLFQTYQFNLLQQMFRHVGEGRAKDVATMLGLQTWIYGINGLPGIQALNTHIIGGASGNPNKTDLYQAVYNSAGKEWGDWMMYGFGSNVTGLFHPDLKQNLYSRGDINPRYISVIPLNPIDMPIAQATARLVSTGIETAKKISSGADIIPTFLRAVEANGVSRPMAGMAQVALGAMSQSGKVTPISSKGNLLMAHDWLSLASGVRLFGGRPLDEAIVTQQMFRFQSYKAKDAASRAVLGEAVKLQIMQEGQLGQESVDSFAEEYLKTGGKQKEFSRFMMQQYRNATVSQANQLAEKLSSPHTTQLQELLGGARLEDLSTPQE